MTMVKEIAKMIDHSLLHPTMTDEILKTECEVAKEYDVASVCIKPYAVKMAAEILKGTDVLVGTVIGFPQGGNTVNVKVFETEQAIKDGAVEIDMVVNIGKVLSEDWEYIDKEIKAISDVVKKNNAVLKVIFENDYLPEDKYKIKLCELCNKHKVDFVKTSTGYGFVKGEDGKYSYKGATEHDLKLMRKYTDDEIEVKAAGGVRTLEDTLKVRNLGVTRIGATATKIIVDAAKGLESKGSSIIEGYYKMKSKIISLFLILLFNYSPLVASNINLYKPPLQTKKANDFKIKINGRENFVYDTKPAAFTYFSFDGKINVEVETTFDVKWVDIRPLSENISFTHDNHKIKFSLDKPVNLSLELNGESSRPLYIFANPLEREKPDSAKAGVLYFKKGKIYNKGLIKLKSNQTIYVEGGAVLQCAIIAEQVENIKIFGRGIIDGSIWEYNPHLSNYVKQKIMVFKNSNNINIEGVTIVNSPGWTMKFKDCNNIKIDNMKHINWKYGSDGIDLVSTSNVAIKNCFLRDNDDNITIKSWGGDLKYSDKQINGNDIKNILVENCVLWNMAWGNALEIGFELRCDKVSDVVFRNIDIIHVERSAAISIHNGDYATVENILYDDIRIEDATHKLIDLGIFISQYSLDRHADETEREKRYLHGAWDGVQDASFYGKQEHAKYRGKIRNITFKNIKVVGGRIPFSLMVGYDDKHNIENVIFENLQFYGKKILNAKDAKLYLEYADNILFN